MGLEGTFSAGIVRDCALLGSLLPHERAAKAYAQMSGIAVSASTCLRLTRREGERYAGVLEQEASSAWAGLEGEPTECPVVRATPESAMSLSMDGTMVNVRGEGWKEVKVAVVSEVETEASSEEEPKVHLTQSSYRAGLWEVRAFERQQWAEGLRRGLDRTEPLACVNDGAKYLWEIVGNCYPHAVAIVDWWHAVERLWKAGEAVAGARTPEAQAWVSEQKERLWNGEVQTVLYALSKEETVASPQALEEQSTYFRNNGHRMAYADYRAQGLPIGSGAVEGGGCKQLVGSRLKQAGMRWSREGANAILALRSALLSDRWDQVWTSS